MQNKLNAAKIMTDLRLLVSKALNEFYGQDEDFTYKIDISNLHSSYLPNLHGIIENDGLIIVSENSLFIEVSL